ncbi:MAG: hypothetical protein PHG02_04300 [Oscillospiraceae bacterium]|nr:hypothetical protein [Oscillospiraceae bacterium]
MADFELFNSDGHITDDGLKALIDGTLTDLGNLEAAEHLSFCDSCTLRYTGLLCDDTLLAPPTPLAEPILKRIRKRTRTIFFNRYATVAAAAVFAIGLWGIGVFAPDSPFNFNPGSGTQLQQTIQQQPTAGLSLKAAQFTQSINEAIDHTFNQILDNISKGVNDNEKK